MVFYRCLALLALQLACPLLPHLFVYFDLVFVLCSFIFTVDPFCICCGIFLSYMPFTAVTGFFGVSDALVSDCHVWRVSIVCCIVRNGFEKRKYLSLPCQYI